MTKEENVYADTLDLLGSDINPPEIQELLDNEHRLADPEWWKRKEAEDRKRAKTLEASIVHPELTC